MFKDNKIFIIIITAFITALITVLVTAFIGEPIKLRINKFFSKAQISCEVLSLSNLSNKYELKKYEEAESLDPFRLNIDDPLLDKYYIYKVRLTNKGISIKESIRFRILIVENCAKILDIKNKVEEPRNKKLLISYSIPDLKWNINNYREGYETKIAKITWNDDYCDYVLCYNIYKSPYKDVGYCRINEKLLNNNQYDLFIDNLSISYFAVEAIYNNGKRIQFNPLKFPDLLAFQPFFDNVIWINPNINPEEICSDTRKSTYYSLEQALEKENHASTFIVKKYKNKIVSTKNLKNNCDDKVKVLYLDDLKFLKGETEISLISGLDEEAEITFYFLCKILSGANSDMSIALEGHPEIKFDFLKYKTNTNLSTGRGENNFLNSKRLLITPPYVTFYQSKKDIYLVWECPKDPMYKGVRFFRADYADINDEDKKGYGDPIYEGPGNTNTCICALYEKPLSKPVPSYNVGTPPPRKDANAIKASEGPTVLKIVGWNKTVKLNKKDDKILPFFVDSNLCSDYRYKYTLWAYDDNDNYSFPVVVKASLKDYSVVVDCNYSSD